MSDLGEPEPHAPAANDASHSALDALKHGLPTCAECGLTLCKEVNGVLVHHVCPVHPAMEAKS